VLKQILTDRSIARAHLSLRWRKHKRAGVPCDFRCKFAKNCLHTTQVRRLSVQQHKGSTRVLAQSTHFILLGSFPASWNANRDSQSSMCCKRWEKLKDSALDADPDTSSNVFLIFDYCKDGGHSLVCSLVLVSGCSVNSSACSWHILKCLFRIIIWNKGQANSRKFVRNAG